MDLRFLSLSNIIIKEITFVYTSTRDVLSRLSALDGN